MKGRFKQFFKAVTAKIRKEDLEFIDNYLPDQEIKKLFLTLPIHEQRHSLDVAYTIIESYRELLTEDEFKILIQGALLHDIGKIGTGLNPVTKSIAVVIDKISPKLGPQMTFLNFIDGYYNHPQKGEGILKKLGVCEKIIYLVKNHHQNIGNIDINKDKLLYFLIESDNKN